MSQTAERTARVERSRSERRGTVEEATDHRGPAQEGSRSGRRATLDDPGATTLRGTTPPKSPPPEATSLVDRRRVAGAAGSSSSRPERLTGRGADRPSALTAPSPAETTMRISRRNLAPDGSTRAERMARLAEPAMAETTLHVPRSALPPASYSFQTGPVPIPLREELAQAPATPPPPSKTAKESPSLLRKVPAGLIDSSLSSLGSFLMGLFSSHFLTDASLGAYGLFYQAFIAVSVIPSGIVFSPVEYTSAGVAARHRRVQLLPQSLQLGALPAIMAALLVPLALFIPSHGQPTSARIGFAVTAAVVAIVSPMQDHIRRMLHQAGMSWIAAATSLVQVVTVALALLTTHLAHVPPAWVPFGALAVANLVSGGFGLWKGKPGHRAPMLLKLRSLLKLGGWIVIGNVMSAGGPFINFALLTALADSTDVGHGEAARVLAQPVTVLVIGLLAVLNPEIMEAANNRNVAKLIKICLLFWGLVAVAIVVWELLVGFEWPFNPLPRLQPKAYKVHGLLPLTILTEGAGYGVLVLISMANASGRARAASAASLVAVVVSAIAVAATARIAGPFSLIWGAGSTVLAMYVVNGTVVLNEFRRPRPAGPPPGQPAPAPAQSAPAPVVARKAPAAAPARREPAPRLATPRPPEPWTPEPRTRNLEPGAPQPGAPRPVAAQPAPGRPTASETGAGQPEVPRPTGSRPSEPRPHGAPPDDDLPPDLPEPGGPRPGPAPPPPPAPRGGRGRHSGGGSLRRPSAFDRRR